MAFRSVMSTIAGSALLVAAAPPTAPAAVTVGSALGEGGYASACLDASGECTLRNRILGGSSANVQVPPLSGAAGGVVVRWRVRDASGDVRLRIMRGSGAVTSSASVQATGGIQTFDARIPVQRGDSFAVDLRSGASIGFLDHPETPPGGEPAAIVEEWSPPLIDATPFTFGTKTSDTEALYNVDVEPDADADGFGDESQDQCPRDGQRQGPCSADLGVTLAGPTQKAIFGRATHFTLTITNHGTSPADAVVATVALPKNVWPRQFDCQNGFRPSAALPPIGFLGCKTEPTALTASAGTLAAGASATAMLSAVVGEGPVLLSATASSSTADPQPANNAATSMTEVTLKKGTCANVLQGTPQADTLTGSSASDRLTGLAGDDTINGLAGADCLKGGTGADVLDGGPGNDRLHGGGGNDVLTGGRGNDTIEAKDGTIDTIDCGAGDDAVHADRKDRIKRCETRTF